MSEPWEQVVVTRSTDVAAAALVAAAAGYRVDEDGGYCTMGRLVPCPQGWDLDYLWVTAWEPGRGVTPAVLFDLIEPFGVVSDESSPERDRSTQ